MPNAYGRAFTTANFLPNLAALKAINFGASDPSGVWFVILNSQTNNVEIWVWDSASNATTDEISVIRPDSIVPNTAGRCIQRLKFDASQLGGFLGSLASLNSSGIIEKTGTAASTNPITTFGRTLINLVDAAAARAALALGNAATRNIGTTSGTVRDAADTAYTNSRTPTSHASTHAAGGADEIAIFGYLAVSANTTLNDTHERLLVDANAASGAIIITLPAASTVGSGWQVQIRKNDTSANTVTVTRSGSDTINGATSIQITSRYQSLVLLSFGGTSWGVVAGFDDWVRTSSDQSIGGVKSFTGSVLLPSNGGSNAGSLWRNTDNLEYRDSTNTTRVLLNNAGNLSNLSNRQTALNNLAGAVSNNRFFKGDGTNIGLSQVALNTADVTGVLSIENGGTNSAFKNFVDLNTPQTISNIKSFGPELRVVNTVYPKIVFHGTSYGTDLKKFQMFVDPQGDFYFAPLNDVENVSPGGFIIKNNTNIIFPSSTASTSTTTGALTIGGGMGVAGNVNIGGFTSFGDATISIKIKQYTGTTDSTTGNANFAHGLTSSKIKGIQILVGGFAPAYLASNFGGSAEYNYFFTSTQFYIVCGTNKNSLLGVTYNVLIIYSA